MTITMDTEKTFDRSPHPFRLKAHEEPRKTEDISQHNKNNLRKIPYLHHIECRKTESIPPKFD